VGRHFLFFAARKKCAVIWAKADRFLSSNRGLPNQIDYSSHVCLRTDWCSGEPDLVCNFSRSTDVPWHLPSFAEQRRVNLVKTVEGIVRGIIIKTVSPEDVRTIQRLLAVEGYMDLGMFQEAEEELRGLNPRWFAFEQVLRLHSRVFWFESV
jgi:hypothetical protein